METLDKNAAKVQRILEMYTNLSEGKVLDKGEEAVRYGVSTKSIQRDIGEIRTFISEHTDTFGLGANVRFDKTHNVYRLEAENNKGFSNKEIFAISKILLDSRAFTKVEMNEILFKLNELASLDEDKVRLDRALINELHHYTELQHKTRFMDNLWKLSKAMQEQKCIKIGYKKERNSSLSYRQLQPMGIVFSEFYFYLVAFIIKDEDNVETRDIDEMYPIIYRVDRIKDLQVLSSNFRINHTDRFQEGEMKKRIQFMQGGKLQYVTFEFQGESIEAVIDRLPTAKVTKMGEGHYEVKAETYGRGIEMWIKSQGDRVRNYRSR